MEPLENAWDSFVEALPEIALFLVILIVGWIVAKAVARILETLLEKIGFDRWVERGGIKRALAKSDYDASDLLSKIVFYGLMLVVLQLAFGVFGNNPVSDLIEGLVSYLPNIFVAILIIVISTAVAAGVRDITQSALGNLNYGKMLANLAYFAIVIVGVFAALDQLEIAETIVDGLFYALLAIVAGSLIIAVGGGGIQPMRSRWEAWLTKAEQEAPRIAAEVSSDSPSSASASTPTPPPSQPDSNY